ncbi:hypothetical protein EJ08DRAFT_702808 [Tothia fuscella]|uniref:Uncharacterized protein n=1 Tax=Tothia fuscella TaxID=1048955 RepID=A0A9P4NFZ5_9PEZI|nr:hypothetical protein EJ08DRAFT_702808 [Tothia fuscella]
MQFKRKFSAILVGLPLVAIAAPNAAPAPAYLPTGWSLDINCVVNCQTTNLYKTSSVVIDCVTDNCTYRPDAGAVSSSSSAPTPSPTPPPTSAAPEPKPTGLDPTCIAKCVASDGGALRVSLCIAG